MNLEKLRGIWDDHARAVYAYLLKLTRSEPDARDFLQDVFHRLARQPDLLDGLHGEARPYLLRLARNAVIDQVRREQVRERVLGAIEADRRGTFAPAEDPDAHTLRQAIARGLAQLPAGQRDVVHARLWKGRTFDEIARASGLSINTVASRYRYGLDKLRELLRDLYEDLTTQASTHTKLQMKNHSDKPQNPLPTEEPLIQPLEQRRVPSATAAGALPVLPIDDDASADLDEPVDAALFDDIPVGDEDILFLDDEDLAFITLPIDFDEMAEGIELIEGEDGVPFDPRILWQTMTPDATTGGGDVPAGVHGEGVVTATGDEDGEVMAEDDPRIYETGGIVDHDPQPVAEAAHTPETAPVEPADIELNVQAHAVIAETPSVPVASSAEHIEVPVATAPALVSVPVEAATDHALAPIELAHHTETAAVAEQDVQLDHTASVADATIDRWVPLDSSETPASADAIESAASVASAGHVIEVDAAHEAHDADAVTVDAGAAAQSSSPTLRQGAMAAALTGSVLLSREAQPRRRAKA